MRSRRSTPKPRCKGARLRVLNQKGGFYNSAFLLLHTQGSFDAEPVRVNPTLTKQSTRLNYDLSPMMSIRVKDMS